MVTNTISQIPLTDKAKKFNFDLEALRGVAAITVVWGHLIIIRPSLDPLFQPAGLWSYAPPAHLSVLVFFVLSGYVIGLAHAVPLTLATTLNYLKKRFVRIYPIYFICLLLALAVAKQSHSWGTLGSHFTLTQGLFSRVLDTFGPAWSLTYEAVFYLLFIPISIYRLSPVYTAALCIVVGCVNAYLFPRFGSPLVSSYAFGFGLWLCGLALARYLRTPKPIASYASMASFLFLFLAIGKLDAPVTIFNQIASIALGRDLSLLPSDQPGVVAFRDFGYLPYCLLIIIAFSGRQVKLFKQVQLVLLALPILTYYYYYKHWDASTVSIIFLPTLFYGLAILLFMFPHQFEVLAHKLIHALIPTGSISYGLYIVHFPILFAFAHLQSFSGTGFTFAARTVCFLAICAIAAYLLEKKFQPWVRKAFF